VAVADADGLGVDELGALGDALRLGRVVGPRVCLARFVARAGPLVLSAGAVTTLVEPASDGVLSLVPGV
jgi:hypothetical protein